MLSVRVNLVLALCTDKVVADITNEGVECWKKCGKISGVCPGFCGEFGVCCRQNFTENCIGLGPAKYHACVAPAQGAAGGPIPNERQGFGFWAFLIMTGRYALLVIGVLTTLIVPCMMIAGPEFKRRLKVEVDQLMKIDDPAPRHRRRGGNVIEQFIDELIGGLAKGIASIILIIMKMILLPLVLPVMIPIIFVQTVIETSMLTLVGIVIVQIAAFSFVGWWKDAMVAMGVIGAFASIGLFAALVKRE